MNNLKQLIKIIDKISLKYNKFKNIKHHENKDIALSKRFINPNKEVGLIPILINNKIKVNALIDSGATKSSIAESFYNKLKKAGIINLKNEFNTNLKLIAVNGENVEPKKGITVKIKINEFSWKFQFLIIKNLPIQVILGYDFQKHSDLILYPRHNKYFFGFKKNRIYSLCTILNIS